MTLQNYSSFVLKQRITAFINRYEYYGREGETEALLAFVEQKRFNLREEITAWATPEKGAVVFTLKAEKVLDIHGKFLVTAPDGALIGYLRKVLGKSLLRSTWEVCDPADKVLLTVRETNAAVAVIRRVGGLLPIIGDILQYLPYNFEFIREGARVGYYNRQWGWRDNYDIALEPVAADVDRRLVMALGIALDALQGR